MTLHNLLGVPVAGAAAMMLGWFWFDLLFGRAYALVLGREHPPVQKPGALYIAGPSLCMLVTTIAISLLMGALAVPTLGAAIALGLLVGVGLLGATAVNMGINPNIPRPLAYGFLSASYFVVSSIVISIILFLLG